MATVTGAGWGGGDCAQFTSETAFRLKKGSLRKIIITSLRDAEEMCDFVPELSRLEHLGQEFDFLFF